MYLHLTSVQLSDLVRVSAESPPANVASMSYPLSPTLREHRGRGREQNDCKSQRSGFERNSVSGRGRATTLRTGASQSHSKMAREELRCPHASLRSYGWVRLLRESV